MTTLTESTCKRKAVLGSYLKMLFTGVILTLAAIVTAKFFNKYYPLPEICKNYLEYLGYVAWVTSLGGNGLAFLTWTQKSPAELLDQRLAQISSLIGVFTFVFARELAMY